MKTAISLPDTLFETAENVAGRLGMSRSQLYQLALILLVIRDLADGSRRFCELERSLDSLALALAAATFTEMMLTERRAAPTDADDQGAELVAAGAA